MTAHACVAIAASLLAVAGCGGAPRRAVERDDPPPPRAEEAPPDPVTYADAEIEAMFDSLRDELTSCAPFSGVAVTFDVTFTADGRLIRDDSALMAAATASCLDEILAEARMPRTVRLARTVAFDGSGVWGTTAPAEEPVTERVRRALNAAGRELFACAGGREGLVITVAWSTNGSLGASVPLGEGSAIESCIRRVVARLSIDPPASAGVVEYVLTAR